MKTIDFSFFIERFISGEMDEAEKQWFQKELEGNEKLRREVDLRRRTDSVLRNQDVLNLRAKLNAIEKQRRVAEPVRKHSGQKGLRYAAIIAGAAVVGGIIFFSGNQMGSDEIISRYYKTYETTLSSRSDATPANSDYTLALEYYKVHDYRNAALYFSRVLEKDPANMQSVLLNGISNFENQNYPEAKQSFNNIIDDDNNLYIDHAKWYLSLCYIKTGEQEKARAYLKNIKSSGSIYRNDAKKILRKLK